MARPGRDTSGRSEEAYRHGSEYDHRESRDAKTSAAAAFALIFGVCALFAALTALLAPLAVLFGIIALILAFVGIAKARQTFVTGKGVAIGGLVTGLLGLLLGVALIAGFAIFLSNEANLDRVEARLDDLRAGIPTELPTP